MPSCINAEARKLWPPLWRSATLSKPASGGASCGKHLLPGAGRWDWITLRRLNLKADSRSFSISPAGLAAGSIISCLCANWSARVLWSSRSITRTISQGYLEQELDRRRADLKRGMNFPSEEGYRETLAFCDNRARERAKDASAILDALIGLNAHGGIPGGVLLDTDHTGIMGFSFGGAVSSQARLQDARFTAAINMDGWHFAEAIDGVPPPHLFMVGSDTLYPSAAELASSDPEQHFGALLNKREYDQHIASMKQSGGLVLTIPSTDHFNFSDGNFQGTMLRRLLGGSLMHRPGGLGQIDPHRAYEIISAHALAFFETYLKNRPSPLLHPLNTPYPEAQLQAWPYRDRTVDIR